MDGVAMGFPFAPVLANIFIGFHESKWFKDAEATKVGLKNVTSYFYCSNRYLRCIRARCENFFKFVYVASEKNEKLISTCDKAFFASMRSCLQSE